MRKTLSTLGLISILGLNGCSNEDFEALDRICKSNIIPELVPTENILQGLYSGGSYRSLSSNKGKFIDQISQKHYYGSENFSLCVAFDQEGKATRSYVLLEGKRPLLGMNFYWQGLIPPKRDETFLENLQRSFSRENTQ